MLLPDQGLLFVVSEQGALALATPDRFTALSAAAIRRANHELHFDQYISALDRALLEAGRVPACQQR